MKAPMHPGAFEGDLQALSFVELLQTLNLGGKTARLALRANSGTGTVWFQDGAVVHADAGPLLGDLAVYEMAGWTSGRFLVEYGITTEIRSTTGDTTQLLLEALRRIDERASDPTPKAPGADTPLAPPADVRAVRSRGALFGMCALVLICAAIAAASVHDAGSTSTTDLTAAITRAPLVPRVKVHAPPRAKRSTPARPKPTEAAVVVEPQPVVAPESPLAEESVPMVESTAPPTVSNEQARATGAPAVPSRLRIAGKSGAGGGTLKVLVDGAPVFTQERLDKNEPFEGEIELAPGEHLIVARVEHGDDARVEEDSARATFAGGEIGLLRVSANRFFGSRLKVKLDAPSRTAGESSAVQ